MNKFKNATKRITAVATSALMVSSAAFASLGDYPSNMVSGGAFAGQVVVGAAADAMDTTSASSIIDDLASEFSGENEKVKISYRKSGTGGEEIHVARSNSALNYGETVGSVTEQAGFDKQDADVLEDGRFDNDISDEDYDQTLLLVNGEFNHALRDEVDGVDEIADGIFFNNGDVFANYTLDMDSAIDLSGTDADNDIIGHDIEIMGSDFTIGDLDIASDNNVSKLVLVGGANKIAIGEGESTTVTTGGESYEISVQSVASGTPNEVLLTVNGETRTIDEFDTEDVAGVTIAVTDLVPSSRDSVKGYAEIVVGGQKISLENGNVQVNDEDVNDLFPDYNVEVVFTAGGLDDIIVSYSVDDDTLLQAGDSLDDVLFDAFALEFRGINDVEWTQVDVNVNGDNVDIVGTTIAGEAFNRPFLHMEDDSDANSSVWLRGDQEADRIFFENSINGTFSGSGPNTNVLANATTFTWNFTSTTNKGSGFLLEEDSEEQYIYEFTDLLDSDNQVDFDEWLRNEDESDIEVTDIDTDLGKSFGAVPTGVDTINIHIADLGDEIAFEGELLLELDAWAETTDIGAQMVNLTFGLDTPDVSGDSSEEESDAVTLQFSHDATDEEFNVDSVNFRGDSSFSGFQNSASGLANNEDGSTDVQTFVTRFGMMVEYDNDEETWAKIMVPDEQVEAEAYVVFGSTGAVESTVTVDSDAVEDKKAELEADGYTITGTETMTSEEVTFDVTAPVMDSDVTGMDDMIVVGGPAVNTVAADLLGLTFPTTGSDSGVNEGEAVIRYFSDSNSVLVYGWSAEDTKAAADKLNAGGLSGDSVSLS